jgi:CcmD family protein
MDTARSILHLNFAYAATWVIHLSYMVYLTRKAIRLRREIRGE